MPYYKRHNKLCLRTQEECLSGLVASSLDDIIYVNDPETYEVLWLNEICGSHFSDADIAGQKCYQLFQNFDAPCPFCPMHKLSHDKFYTWEHYNEKIGRYFRVKDKFILFKGKTLHMEIATDITESVLEQQNIQNKLVAEQTLLQCVRTLLEEENFNTAVEKALLLAGRLYEADRCYVFESKYDASGADIVVNTHEWCAPGVTPQKNQLQHVPYAVVSPWMNAFGNSTSVIINDLEDIRDVSPDLYNLLKPQDIHSVFVVPLHINGLLSGFIGVDNPRNSQHDLTLLHSLAYFIDNTISKTRMADELRTLGLRDPLTGLGNRNAYLTARKGFADSPASHVGIAFIDLNGLKRINDTYGHEKGDEFIQGMSRIFARHFRSSDIFRIGGDEFVFVCNNIREDIFLHKLDSMRRECEAAYPGGLALGQLWQASVSDLDALIQQADERMYQEKKRIKAQRS